MELKQQFDVARQRARELTVRPSDADLLQLYALFKQAKEGDVYGSTTGLDLKAAAKYNAWSRLRGMSREDAMTEYIAMVEELHQREKK